MHCCSERDQYRTISPFLKASDGKGGRRSSILQLTSEFWSHGTSSSGGSGSVSIRESSVADLEKFEASDFTDFTCSTSRGLVLSWVETWRSCKSSNSLVKNCSHGGAQASGKTQKPGPIIASSYSHWKHNAGHAEQGSGSTFSGDTSHFTSTFLSFAPSSFRAWSKQALKHRDTNSKLAIPHRVECVSFLWSSCICCILLQLFVSAKAWFRQKQYSKINSKGLQSHSQRKTCSHFLGCVLFSNHFAQGKTNGSAVTLAGQCSFSHGWRVKPTEQNQAPCRYQNQVAHAHHENRNDVASVNTECASICE